MATDLTSLANSAADQYGVPRSLLYALVGKETRGDPKADPTTWNPYAIGSSGEIGLTQLMPNTVKQLGLTNAFDPTQNLSGGASFLSQLKAKYGDWRQALSAYNSGSPTSAAGLSYADSILGAAGDLTPPAPATTGSSILDSFLTQLGKDIGIFEKSADPNSNTATAGEALGVIGDALPGALGGLGSTMLKGGLLAVLVIAALILGLLALSRSTRDQVLPVARNAVT